MRTLGAWVASVHDPGKQSGGNEMKFLRTPHERFAISLWAIWMAAALVFGVFLPGAGFVLGVGSTVGTVIVIVTCRRIDRRARAWDCMRRLTQKASPVPEPAYESSIQQAMDALRQLTESTESTSISFKEFREAYKSSQLALKRSLVGSRSFPRRSCKPPL